MQVLAEDLQVLQGDWQAIANEVLTDSTEYLELVYVCAVSV